MADKTLAKLTLEVEFDVLPSKDDVNDTINAANGAGKVVQADLEIVTPAEIDVRGWWD